MTRLQTHQSHISDAAISATKAAASPFLKARRQKTRDRRWILALYCACKEVCIRPCVTFAELLCRGNIHASFTCYALVSPPYQGCIPGVEGCHVIAGCHRRSTMPFKRQVEIGRYRETFKSLHQVAYKSMFWCQRIAM